MLRIANIKNVVLIVLTCKSHHIASRKIARKSVKEEFDYHGGGAMSMIV